MSGEDRREGAPQGPPWSLDVVADFHAGALDADTTERLRPRLHADEGARQLLAALDATREEVAATPVATIPDDVAVRIETALADEAFADEAPAREPVSQHTARPVAAPQEPFAQPSPARDATVVDFEAAGRRARGRRSRRRYGWGAAVVAVAAAALGVVVLGTPVLERSATPPQAIEPTAPAADPSTPLAVRGDEVKLSSEQLTSVLGSEEYTSKLSDPTRMLACLRANGIDSGNPVGAREITVNGRPAQLFVLPTGDIGKFRLLAVGTGCGTGNPATISNTTVG